MRIREQPECRQVRSKGSKRKGFLAHNVVAIGNEVAQELEFADVLTWQPFGNIIEPACKTIASYTPNIYLRDVLKRNWTTERPPFIVSRYHGA